MGHRLLRPVTIEQLNAHGQGTMSEALGIRFTKVGDDFLEAVMPVDARTKQPYGLLHGGASVALAETLGSVGSALAASDDRVRCVGLEINANHVRSVTDGEVTGRATPLHVGKSTQVWDIRITTPKGELVCVSRLTIAVVPLRNP